MVTTIQQTDMYRQVFAWLRGGDATPDPQMENTFLDLMTAAVAERLIANRQENERMARAAERAERRANRPSGCLSIKAMLEQVRSEDSKQIDTVLADDEDLPEAEPVKESPISNPVSYTNEEESHELDSALLVMALRHMAVIEGIELTQSQIQSILYIAYGVRLAQKNERLTAEHPQMWQYGPVFPRAYNRLRKDAADGTDEYYSLKTNHPNIYRYLENCFRRYAWTKACILSSPHLSDGSPWYDTRKSNPDRWGVRIEDELIREWFLQRV
jgi:uncharacterized phage-associated protein